MIENLKDDELYQLEKNKQNVLNFVLTLGRSWRTKNAPKLSSKYLKDRICKIKRYLNYILLIINQYILVILRTFLNQQKIYEKLYTNRSSHMRCSIEKVFLKIL